jgi:hypothetical protein
MKTRAHFRLIHMPCCGQMLCWVNPNMERHEMFKFLTIAAILVALLSPAKAGSNECSGPIVIDKEWVRINEERNERPCRVKLNSDLGRHVLAVCPVGADCELFLPIQGNDKVMAVPVNGMRTVIKIEGIQNNDVRTIAIVRTMLKKCTNKLSADKLQKISAAHEVMAERMKISMYSEQTVGKAIKNAEQEMKNDRDFCESMSAAWDWSFFTNKQ